MTSILIEHFGKQPMHVARCGFRHRQSADNAALSRLASKIRQFYPGNEANASLRDLEAHARNEQARHGIALRQAGLMSAIGLRALTHTAGEAA